VNFPLHEGMDDLSFEYIFKKVIDNIYDKYRPNAIVMQCGSDSLSGDRLGCFNLSVKGHGNCLKYVRNLNLPLLILGGGGYTLRNVPRCWTYETGIALGLELDDDLPRTDFHDYFYPEYKLHMPVSNMENANTPEYLNYVLENIENNLKQLNVGSTPIQVEGYANPSIMNDVDIKGLEQDFEDRNVDNSRGDSSRPSKHNMEFD
jgi:histone deacetylase 1/2